MTFWDTVSRPSLGGGQDPGLPHPIPAAALPWTLCCPRAWQPWELRPPHWDTGQKADHTETGNAGTRDGIGGRAGEGTAGWCLLFKNTFFIGNKKRHVSWRCSNVHKGYGSSCPITSPKNPRHSSSSCGLLTFPYVDNTHIITQSHACKHAHTPSDVHKHAHCHTHYPSHS